MHFYCYDRIATESSISLLLLSDTHEHTGPTRHWALHTQNAINIYAWKFFRKHLWPDALNRTWKINKSSQPNTTHRERRDTISHAQPSKTQTHISCDWSSNTMLSVVVHSGQIRLNTINLNQTVCVSNQVSCHN